MLNLILAESAIELVPKLIWKDPSVINYAKKIGKDPGKILLDRTYHHHAMFKIKEAMKRGRPDIIHMSLLEALGTPLNKEGLLRTYVHTINNYIIYPNPEVRLPRNYDRFCRLIEQLYDLKIISAVKKPLLKIATEGLKILFEKINPSYVVAFTRIGTPETIFNIMRRISLQKSLTFIIGGFPKGHFSPTIIKNCNELISIDRQTLEASVVVSRVIYEYEKCMNIDRKRLRNSI